MAIFDINFPQASQSLTPPELRKDKLVSFLKSLIAPQQYLHNLVFDDYANGSSYSGYSATSAYTIGDRVTYIDRRTYENLSGSTGVDPTDIYTWRFLNPIFIGARERVKYNAQIMVYEYALNRYFQTTGIYITNTPLIGPGMLIGLTGPFSSNISVGTSPSASYINGYFSGFTNYYYTIFVPNATFTGLSTTYFGSSQIIRSFADTLNLAGMRYSVSGY